MGLYQRSGKPRVLKAEGRGGGTTPSPRCFSYFFDLTSASQQQLYAATQAVAKLREEVRREQALLEGIKYDLHLEDVVNAQVRFAPPQAASSRSSACDSLLVVALCSTRACLS